MTRLRLNANERSEAIIAAAMPLFARKGFAGATIKELALAAGVSEALLYKHFSNKEAIYAAILTRGFNEAAKERLRFLSGEPSTASLIQHVHFLMCRFFTDQIACGDQSNPGEFRNMLRLVLNSLMEDGAFARQVFEHIDAGPRVDFEASYSAAIRAGDVIPGIVKCGNAFWFMHHLALTLGAMRLPQESVLNHIGTDDAVVRQAVVFVLRGLGMKEDVIAAKYDHKALSRTLRSTIRE
jgi:TetR/AcrR family transcriptional regulator, transcriptional repressor of aconitase